MLTKDLIVLDIASRILTHVNGNYTRALKICKCRVVVDPIYNDVIRVIKALRGI